MSKQVPWNEKIIDEFVRLAMLSEDEENIIRTRAKGWSIVKQSRSFNMSTSTIDRVIARLKIKYDNVQPYSDILPERKFTVKDTYSQ